MAAAVMDGLRKLTGSDVRGPGPLSALIETLSFLCVAPDVIEMRIMSMAAK
jgi:hypothetical protein